MKDENNSILESLSETVLHAYIKQRINHVLLNDKELQETVDTGIVNYLKELVKDKQWFIDYFWNHEDQNGKTLGDHIASDIFEFSLKKTLPELRKRLK